MSVRQGVEGRLWLGKRRLPVLIPQLAYERAESAWRGRAAGHALKSCQCDEVTCTAGGVLPQSRLAPVIRFEKGDTYNNPEPSGVVLKMLEAPTLFKGQGMINCISMQGIRKHTRGEKGVYRIGPPSSVGYS
jgi:hypothetical protein